MRLMKAESSSLRLAIPIYPLYNWFVNRPLGRTRYYKRQLFSSSLNGKALNTKVFQNIAKLYIDSHKIARLSKIIKLSSHSHNIIDGLWLISFYKHGKDRRTV